MTTKPTREQMPLYNRFKQLLDDPKFSNDIEKLSHSNVDIRVAIYENIEEFEDGSVNADELPSPLHEIMTKYKLPLVMEDFIYHYVATGEISLDRLRTGVYLVDHTVMEASGNVDPGLNYQQYVEDTMRHKYIELTLAVPVYATTTQIADTVAEHQQFIKDRQKELNDGQRIKRVRLSPKTLRNAAIMRLYEQGYKPREIVQNLPEDMQGKLTGPDVSKIINKLKLK